MRYLNSMKPIMYIEKHNRLLKKKEAYSLLKQNNVPYFLVVI